MITDPTAFLADTPLEEMVDAELLGDHAQVLVLPLELERRGSPDDAQLRDLREQSEEFLGEPVGKVLLVPGLTDIDEGQHRDRRHLAGPHPSASHAEDPRDGDARHERGNAEPSHQAAP